MADNAEVLTAKVSGLLAREGKTSISEFILESAVKDNTTKNDVPVNTPVIIQTAPIDEITGFSFGALHQVLYFSNFTGAQIIFRHNSESSMPANRLIIPNGADFTVPNGHTVRFVREPIASVWIMTAFPVLNPGVPYGPADIGTLTWTGTPPTGITKKWRGEKIGNIVFVYFKIDAIAAGSAITEVKFHFPTQLPQPAQFSDTPAGLIPVVTGNATMHPAADTNDTDASANIMKLADETLEVQIERMWGGQATKSVHAAFTYMTAA